MLGKLLAQFVILLLPPLLLLQLQLPLLRQKESRCCYLQVVLDIWPHTGGLSINMVFSTLGKCQWDLKVGRGISSTEADPNNEQPRAGNRALKGLAHQVHLNDLLQVPPGLLQGFHGEPGVGVGGHAETLDLAVQFS